MRKKTAAVLNVGSSKLQLMEGERGLNKTFITNRFAEVGYEGFSQSSFFAVEDVGSAIRAAVKKAEAGYREKIETLYVGVPGEFIVSKSTFFNISLPRKKRITREDIEKLYNTAYTPNSKNFRLIARSAVSYILSGGRKVSTPEGQVSDTLGGTLVFYLCDARFIGIFDKALSEVGVRNVRYYPAALAEVMYLFEPYERDKGGILVDVGYLTTSFSCFLGNAITYGNSFSLGGGHISAQLLEDFNLSFAVANRLKEMVNISYNPYSGANYEFNMGNKFYSVPVTRANASVKSSLDRIAEEISKCIEEGVISRGGDIVISLTGGGVSYIRGAKEYLAGRLGAIVKIVAPKVPILGKPINSSLLSMMDLALGEEERNGR